MSHTSQERYARSSGRTKTSTPSDSDQTHILKPFRRDTRCCADINWYLRYNIHPATSRSRALRLPHLPPSVLAPPIGVSPNVIPALQRNLRPAPDIAKLNLNRCKTYTHDTHPFPIIAHQGRLKSTMSFRPGSRIFSAFRPFFRPGQADARRRASTAAGATQGGFAGFWNSPIGPKTVHFWYDSP